MQAKTFAIIISVLIAILVIEMIRQQKMTFKYSITWLMSSAVIIFFAVYDKLLLSISLAAGFSLLSNFIFFIAIAFFIVMSLMLTVYANQENNRSETLAQSIAALEYKIKKLEQKITP